MHLCVKDLAVPGLKFGYCSPKSCPRMIFEIIWPENHQGTAIGAGAFNWASEVKDVSICSSYILGNFQSVPGVLFAVALIGGCLYTMFWVVYHQLLGFQGGVFCVLLPVHIKSMSIAHWHTARSRTTKILRQHAGIAVNLSSDF